MLAAASLLTLTLTLTLVPAASARYYLLHPQGRADYCLSADVCASRAADEFPLVTERCTGAPAQQWTTRLIGDTETITWQPAQYPSACINANSERSPATAQSAQLAQENGELTTSDERPAADGAAGGDSAVHAERVQQVAGLCARWQPADRRLSRRDA